MARRLLLFVVFASLLGMAALRAARSASPVRIKKWSQQWLALNHTKYDNPLTAQYEHAIGYGKGQATAPAGVRFPTDVRMSNPSFAGNQNEFQIDINPTDSRHAIGSSAGRSAGSTGDAGPPFAATVPRREERRSRNLKNSRRTLRGAAKARDTTHIRASTRHNPLVPMTITEWATSGQVPGPPKEE